MIANEEKLILASMKTTFEELQNVVRRIDFDPHQSNSKHLPLDICNNVVDFLAVKRCKHSEADAVAASSMDNRYKLTGVLVDDEDSWWLSGDGTMPGGTGEAYVEVRLAKNNTLRRIQAVSMSIPPLPMGPLSVREFRVDVASEEGVWVQLPFAFVVESRRGMQRFPIGDIDARSIRVVCLSNQVSHLIPEAGLFDQVGFYAIKLE